MPREAIICTGILVLPKAMIFGYTPKQALKLPVRGAFCHVGLCIPSY